jgi:flagella basal body P-ring formation protein FlgA
LLIQAFLLAVLVCSAKVAAAEVAACTVRLRSSAEVASVNPVLGDVADVRGSDESVVGKLAQLALGPVIDPRLFTRADIQKRIRDAFPDRAPCEISGSDYLRVSLAGRTPDREEIAALLRAHLAGVTSWHEDEIEIRSIENLKAQSLPVGEVQVRITARGIPANFHRLVLPVEISIGGRVARTFFIVADARIRARVVETTRPMSFRTVLSESDLREVVREIEDPRAAYVRSISEAVGMVVKRALREREILTRRSVDAASLVRNGDTVRLTVQINGIQVAAMGRALQDGKLGQRIKIRNLDSDRSLVAEVTGQREARIVQ